MPLVSIIIPCYKSEQYIRQCLESLQKQMFVSSWEAIVVDDKPSQEMIEMMKEAERQDPRIHFHARDRKTNPATARNHALEFAKGDFIAFLDSDDWWDSRKLYKMLVAFHQSPRIQWCAHYVTEYRNFCYKTTEVYPGHSISLGGTGAIMCRRDLLDKVKQERGFVFNERMNRNDDADLILYIRHEPSHLVPEQLSFMRIRSDGLESSVSDYENYRIFMGMAWRNAAFGLMTPHTILFLFRLVGIDPIKVKQKVMNFGRLQKVS